MCALGFALGLCVYRQTAASLDAHKCAKSEEKSRGGCADSAVHARSAVNGFQSKMCVRKEMHTILYSCTHTIKKASHPKAQRKQQRWHQRMNLVIYTATHVATVDPFKRDGVPTFSAT